MKYKVRYRRGACLWGNQERKAMDSKESRRLEISDDICWREVK